MAMDRRAFLQLLTAGAASAGFPSSIARALEISPHRRTGTIEDVEHIVFLMQENRSFDHYFGMLRGVRGFGDPRAVRLASGDPVWKQPHGEGYVLPFHPPAPESSEAGLGLTFLQDLAHDWTTTHAAWNEGRHDRWVPSKGPVTMAHLTRSDIPFHYALADAFTVCDAYYCSLLGPTDPNRYHMFTGWVGNNGEGGGPVVGNEESGYGWLTYPERLQKAGVSWKVYQDAGLGLDAAGKWGQAEDAYIGNYGDNALLYFHQYEKAGAESPLHRGAKTGTRLATGRTNVAKHERSLFEIFAADVKAKRLPQVSWVVAPEAYSEHPNWPANYGAWYVAQILDALTANPEVWSRTALFLMFDENDGFFDHAVPPTPPMTRAHGLSTVDTTHEIFAGNEKYVTGPYGLGVRVPMLVISPWSRGGWVNSQVFDHTSLIRFVERRFGVHEPNITPWRRAVAGDLTSAFDFNEPSGATIHLPSTVTYRPPDGKRHPDYKPAPPAEQRMPEQEPGTRPARALPYDLAVDARLGRGRREVELTFHNSAGAGAVFHMREGAHGPRSYTVGAHAELKDTLPVGESGYAVSIYGPNGFYRAFEGRVGGVDAEVTAKHVTIADAAGEPHPSITLTLRGESDTVREITILDGYTKTVRKLTLRRGEMAEHHCELKETFGWYDLLVTADRDAKFRRHFAGHVETGQDSTSDPAMSKV
jgi:phospholipase C